MPQIKNKNFCPLEYAMSYIGGKWKPLILWHLTKDGVLRYGELKRKLHNISHKVLAEQLKELEHSNLIIRIEYYVVPPKVEYQISELGETLIPIFDLLHQWGEDHQNLM